jgi:hypothetical protein
VVYKIINPPRSLFPLKRSGGLTFGAFPVLFIGSKFSRPNENAHLRLGRHHLGYFVPRVRFFAERFAADFALE